MCLLASAAKINYFDDFFCRSRMHYSSELRLPYGNIFIVRWVKLAIRFKRVLTTFKLVTVESRLYVQVGTQKFGRRTERDVQVKIIFRITP